MGCPVPADGDRRATHGGALAGRVVTGGMTPRDRGLANRQLRVSAGATLLEGGSGHVLLLQRDEDGV